MIKRTLLVLFICLLPFAAARERAYLGLRFSVASPLYTSDGLLSLGLQAGLQVGDTLEVRAALESSLLDSLAYADVLYVQRLDDTLRAYVGAGPEYASFSLGGASGSTGSYGVHLTAGLEATDVVGVFAEVQPALAFASSSLWVRFSAGFNYHLE